MRREEYWRHVAFGLDLGGRGAAFGYSTAWVTLVDDVMIETRQDVCRLEGCLSDGQGDVVEG